MFESLFLLTFLCHTILSEAHERFPFLVDDIKRDLAQKALDWLRDMNRKKIKDSYDTSAAAKPEGLSFDALLRLLLPMMEARATSGNSLKEVSHTLDYEDPGQTSRPENDPEINQSQTIKKEVLILERRIVQLLESRFSIAQRTSVAEEDDDLSFFKSLIPSFKELPLHRRMILRSKIMNCVIAELE
ncbi:uncharacterized protein LOC129003193 [Macrosteles quadrilineatus]|uniref:uncharacterized protein LOC129003193 n=1 Tax=Macrosteles quadrilineatus TaxID=74068 RepID=UPI0023E17BDA|nr:uncharacterized protein LOC129003193 [Macrosteles quadrilineatus]